MAAKTNGNGTNNGGGSQGSGGKNTGGYMDLDEGESGALLHARSPVNYAKDNSTGFDPAAVTAPFSQGGLGNEGSVGSGQSVLNIAPAGSDGKSAFSSGNPASMKAPTPNLDGLNIKEGSGGKSVEDMSLVTADIEADLEQPQAMGGGT